MIDKNVIFLGLANVLVLIALYVVWNLSEISQNLMAVVDEFGEENVLTSNEIALQEKNLKLLERLEYEKLLETITLREREIEAKQAEIAAREKKVADELFKFEEERKQFLAQKERLKKEEEERNNYDVKIAGLANQFVSMPPENAVERLLAIGDDSLIIDILNKIDGQAAENGQTSIVPFFISLMPKEDASRIVRNSVVTF